MLQAVANWLFDPSGAAAHGACLRWQPELIWLYAISSLLTGLALLSVPIVLAAIVRRRSDLAFGPAFAVTVAFVLLCGADQLINVVTVWVPAYGLQVATLAVTAAVSVVAAAGLWRIMPQMLALPSPAHMRRATQDLRAVQLAEGRMAAIAAEASGARDALARELARRVIAEKQMQESDERFQLLLHSNVTEALYLLGPDGTIETWNVAAERIKGYHAEEIIGQNFAVFFTPENQAQGVPAAMLARARDSGRFSTEGWRVRKDGVRFRARVSIDAIRRPDGALRGFVKATQDITDRLIEEEQRATIIEAAPSGMVILDERGVITLANKQAGRIFGSRADALVGRTLEALIPQEQSDMHDLLRMARARGLDGQAMVPQRSFELRRQDGSVATIELMANTVATPRGHVVVASLVDASERVRESAEREAAQRHERLTAETANVELDRLSRHLTRARDRAEEASRAKSRFLAGMTHELRTPLHGVLGYAELLTLEGGLSATQTERLETMMAAGQHLLGMINAVLDMSQIEANQLELQPAEVDLGDVVAVCLTVVRPAAEARGLELCSAPHDVLRVVADPTRLRQVVINLLGNAVKFTAAGHIEVRMRAADGWGGVRVEVADTGPGVRAANISKLFTTFERLNATTTSGLEGTGLGLAISARLIESMQGRIGYADNEGGGSVFWFELPAAPDCVAVAAAPNTREIIDEPALRVLVADDELLNRSIASSFLSRAGHAVTCVGNGAEAVSAAAAEDFDVILMDVRMPGKNGMEATREIRGVQGPRGRVRVVAVTAQAFGEQIDLCRLAGMDAHLSKPFQQATLLAVLRGEGGGIPASKPVPAAGETAPAVPLLDRRMLRQVVEFLPSADVANHLRTLSARCEVLLEQLQAPGVLAETGTLAETGALMDSVHALAGASGMFGCVAVATTARAFERAIMTHTSGAAELARKLETALRATIGVLQNELAASNVK
jgi:PAS domain S-box-containing protein